MSAVLEHAQGATPRQTDIDWFASKGVGAINLAKTRLGEFSFVLLDRVSFLPGGRFEFARDLEGAGELVTAYTFALRNLDGEPADVLAWHPRSGRTATWRGAVGLLGEEQVDAPRSEPLTVHADVLEWLKAGRVGVVILDHHRAARILDGAGPLLVSAVDLGKRLRKQLTIPAPEILVSQAERAAA